jgi:short-subunit dehydrogenase
MSDVVVIAGYGSGISHAVAKRLGKGHKVALIARTAAKVKEAADHFVKEGFTAEGFATDLSNPKAVEDTLRHIQTTMGKISLLFWNGGGVFKALLASSIEELQFNMSINVVSLVHAVKTIQNDLEATKGSVLVTGGGFGIDNPQVNQYVVSMGAGTGGVNKAAEHKAIGILHEELKPKGVFVGAVIVKAMVKGTAWDNGSATLEAGAVAEVFETLLQQRSEPFAHIA